MNRKQILITLALSAVLALPATSATWFVHGTYEPDTARDVTDGFMYADPDISPSGRKVYFNGVANIYFSGQNPNVGAAGTQVAPFGVVTYNAYLGVWKDCNKDGFIGAADGVVAEYRSLLLPTTDVCPEGSDFNKDGWVYEFLWIGHADITSNETAFAARRMINDTQSLVWQDFGLPDGGGVGATCAINPQPQGTYGSTGGMIAYTDCLANRQITSTVNAVGAVLDPSCANGLCIDADRPQNDHDSVFNQRFPVHPWYDPYGQTEAEKTGFLEDTDSRGRRQSPMVSAFDCSQPTTAVPDPTGGQLTVTDPTGLVFDEPINFADEDGNVAYVPTPGVSANPQGSLYDGANATERALVWNCADEDTFVWTNVGEQSNEAAYGGTGNSGARRMTDSVFGFGQVLFNPSFANGANACVFQDDEDLGDVPPGCEDVTLVPEDAWPREQPYDLGLGVFRGSLYGFMGATWYGTPNYVTDPQLIRTDDLNPTGRQHVTYYARVGSATLTTASVAGNPAVYGAAWCNGATTGVVNGWDCDASNWWNPIADPATDEMPQQTVQSDESCTTGMKQPVPNCREMGAKTGFAYHLRDIDCYDGQLVRGVPAYASLVQLTPNGPCDRPS